MLESKYIYLKVNMRNVNECYQRDLKDWKCVEIYTLHTPGWRLVGVNRSDGWLYFQREK